MYMHNKLYCCIHLYQTSGLALPTLPSSPSRLSENPKRPPHIIRLRCLPPSPNSSFHFRRSDNVPRDSEAEGVISLRAFVKFDRESIRDGGGGGVERGDGDCA